MAETAQLHTKIEEVTSLFGELQSTVKSASAQNAEAVAAISERIADLEVQIQKERRVRAVKNGGGLLALEPEGGDSEAVNLSLAIRGDEQYSKSFYRALRTRGGGDPIPTEDVDVLTGRKALTKYNADARIKSAVGTDLAAGAGWLAPATMERAIDRLVVENSPMMDIVGVRPCGTGTYEGLIRNTNREATQALGQREAGTTTTVENRYIKKSIPVISHAAQPAVTQEALEDAFVDLEAELTADAAEQFAVQDGYEILRGNGVDQAKGILNNTSILRVNSGSAATFGMTVVRQLPFYLKNPYQVGGIYLFGRQALIRMIGLRDESGGSADTGQFLWQPSTQAGTPSLFNSFQWRLMVDMDDLGANKLPIAFGKWSEAYRVAMRRGIRIVRDEISEQPHVVFRMSRRWGGDVWKSEAAVLLKCST